MNLVSRIMAYFSSSSAKQEPPPVTRGFEDVSLYYRFSCPYCRYVIAFINANNITIPLMDITLNQHNADTLIKFGGKRQVPCLRIENDGDDVWLYESADIIEYLKTRISANQKRD